MNIVKQAAIRHNLLFKGVSGLTILAGVVATALGGAHLFRGGFLHGLSGTEALILPSVGGSISLIAGGLLLVGRKKKTKTEQLDGDPQNVKTEQPGEAKTEQLGEVSKYSMAKEYQRISELRPRLLAYFSDGKEEGFELDEALKLDFFAPLRELRKNPEKARKWVSAECPSTPTMKQERREQITEFLQALQTGDIKKISQFESLEKEMRADPALEPVILTAEDGNYVEAIALLNICLK